MPLRICWIGWICWFGSVLKPYKRAECLIIISQCVSQAGFRISMHFDALFWAKDHQKTTKRPPDRISGTTGPRKLVRLSKFAEFYKKSDQNILETVASNNSFSNVSVLARQASEFRRISTPFLGKRPPKTTRPYFRNYWTQKNGSPIKICRILQGKWPEYCRDSCFK